MDRVFNIEEITAICTSLTTYFNQFKEYLEELITISEEAKQATSTIPAEVRNLSVDSAADVTSMQASACDIDELLTKLEQVKQRAINLIPQADSQYASQTKELVSQTKVIENALSELLTFIAETPLSGDYKTFSDKLKATKVKWESTLANTKEYLMQILNNVKGYELASMSYSKDPVNLSTGNFIYDAVDLKVKGFSSFTFKRFYNSINTRTGILGRDWKHNYEIHLEGEENEKTLIREQGKEEVFRLIDGRYVSLCQSDGTLEVTDTGYIYRTRNQEIYHFTKEGRFICFEGINGIKRTLYYENTNNDFKLIRVEQSTGEYFTLFYNDSGYLRQVKDHTGRKVNYTIEEELLRSVETPLGHTYFYEYADNGKLKSATNPRKITFIENEYDEKDRTIRQIFPDGNSMCYLYDDDKRIVELTERNGSKVIYVHDEKYRDIKHIYSDGEERFEYNLNNQKTLFIDKLGNKTQYAYDDKGNLSRVINALGTKKEFTYQAHNQVTRIAINGQEKLRNRYNKEGNIIESEDALKQKVTFTYIEKGLPDTITQPDGSTLSLSYDERRNIVKMIDASGVVTQYQYDTLNRVVASIDGNGNKTKYHYDAEGNIVKVINANGDSCKYTYNQSNKVISIENFDGSIVKREYNVLNMPSKVIDQLGRETVLNYDAMWNVSQVIDPLGSTTCFIYNENNKLETIQKPDGNVINYQYDIVGNRTGIIDEAGNKTNFSYDAIGQLIEVSGPEGLKLNYIYNSEGQITSATNAMGHTIHLKYDSLGQLIQETNSLGDTRDYTYTPLGLVESIVDEAGRTTYYKYEKGGRLKEIQHPDSTTECYSYDANGNIKTYVDRKGKKSEYWYDSLNRLIKVSGSQKEEKSYTYDAIGNVIAMINEKGNKTTYEYTLTGHLSRVTDALGNQTEYIYDERDQLIEVCQYGKELIDMDETVQNIKQRNQEIQQVHRTIYKRNSNGEIEKITDALGQEENYRYNTRGQLIEKLDKDGYLTKYGYTAHGEVNHIQYADGKEVKLSYNPLRQLVEIEDWLGITKIDVDELGRATKVTNHKNQTVEYQWGSLNERRKVIYPDGKTITYEYDEALRLTKVNDKQFQTKYHYDTQSRLSQKEFPNGTRTEYRYNAVGQLQELSHWNTEELLDHYCYQYDIMGNKTNIKKERKELLEESGLYTYTYDPLNRLQEVLKEDTLIRKYEYDAFGNRSKMIDGKKQTWYTYNEMNQLISTIDSDETKQSYTYDKRGNVTEVYKNNTLSQQYQFGALNRLERAFNHETSLLADYQYNGLGNRVGKTEGILKEPVLPTTKLEQLTINPTKHIEDVIDLTKQYHNLLQRKENQNVTSYICDSNVLAATGADERYYQYLYDELGSPIRLLDQDGIQEEVYEYDEFGNTLYSSQSQQPFGFTGYQQDSVSNTYYAQAREYLPSVGRFTSEDIVKGITNLPFTLNAYNYCWNHPLNLIDLNGLFPTAADGTEAHIMLQEYLESNEPGVEINVSIAGASSWGTGNYGYADIVYTTPLTMEVYEIKPGSYAPGTINNAAGHVQLYGYINGLIAQGEPARAGTTLNGKINGLTFPSVRHPGKLIKYYTYPSDPGMIYWNYINVPVPECETVPETSKVKEPEKAPEKDPVKNEGFNWVLAFSALVVVVGTLAEDVATGGVGIADDPASFALAAGLFSQAFAR